MYDRELAPDSNPNDNRPTIVSIQDEEVLIVDRRAGLTPAQVVERKLVALLNSAPLPMSRMETAIPRQRVH